MTTTSTKAQWALRLGLGLMYLYSGIDLFRHPTAWHWALPMWLRDIITQFISLNNYLKLQGVLEIVIALIFLCWVMPKVIVKFAALISLLEMLGILILAFFPFSGANFTITFRDIGLLGASTALFFLVAGRDDGNYL